MGNRGALLFDLGGVLVHSGGLQALAQLLPGLSAEEVSSRWHGSYAVGQFERGRISAAEFALSFVAEWNLPLQPTVFLEAFSSWVKGFYPGAEALLRRLRARHVVSCLSNTNAVHWERLVDVRMHFDICVASHLTGYMKPEIPAYECALKELGIPAEQVYFFDDLGANVAAASSIGIRAFRVRGIAELEAMLDSVDLISRNDV